MVRENARGKWALVHADDVRRSLERDIFPAIGALPIGELNAPVVLAVLAVLAVLRCDQAVDRRRTIPQRAVYVDALADTLTACLRDLMESGPA